MPQFKNATLREHAYYKTGGVCAVLCLPESIHELQDCLAMIRKDKLPYFLLGKGTNSLVMDEPWVGAVISFEKLRRHDLIGNVFYCEAGMENSEIAQLLLDKGLAGAGWMFGLPGQLGGTVRMNARCYGGEISQITRKVLTVTPDGKQKTYDDPKIFRGYKDTIFMTNNELIVAAELHLTPGDKSQIKTLMDSCFNDRDSKGQFTLPSCGCVFKNDYSVGIPSGKLLDAVGAKQMHRGGAKVSQSHANFVFNENGTSRDILELSIQMRDKVYEKFGVWLEYEMEILGRVPDDLQNLITTKKTQKPNDKLLSPLRAAFQQANK